MVSVRRPTSGRIGAEIVTQHVDRLLIPNVEQIKCDGKLPACTHCINYKTDCVFTQVEKKRSPPKGYVIRAIRSPSYPPPRR